ncbi:hypothetical protein C8255_10625 [filamentous cyanobacterium CCP3]|nr:hypothetical protein C8255_10625 [filamentous cyanobacterium CCP3]
MLRVKELKRQLFRAEEENQRLKIQLGPSKAGSTGKDSLPDLKSLGIEMNSTLERLIRETPEGIVFTAIESLREAKLTGSIINLGGFLNKAIRAAWRPNGAYQKKVDIEEFNSWWKWAYGKRLVKAATQRDGVHYVLTTEEQWLILEEALRIFPKGT